MLEIEILISHDEVGGVAKEGHLIGTIKALCMVLHYLYGFTNGLFSSIDFFANILNRLLCK